MREVAGVRWDQAWVWLHAGVPAALALALALGCLCVEAPRAIQALARDPGRRLDALLFALLVGAALWLRLAVPWGPMDFAEAARLEPAWGSHPGILPEFSSVTMPLWLLRAAGVAPAELLRAGPFLGALGVGLVYPLSRAASCSRGAALLAGCILLVWPAHVRYSASPITVAAASLVTAFFIIAMADALRPRVRLLLFGALIVLCLHARSELIVLLPAALPFAFRPGLGARARVAAATVALLALACSLPIYIGGQCGNGFAGVSSLVGALRHVYLKGALAWVALLFSDFRLNPVWWIAAGFTGLVAGRLPRALRDAIALLTAMLWGIELLFGNEENPLWVAWRYFLPLAPLLSLAAAALVERLVADRRKIASATGKNIAWLVGVAPALALLTLLSALHFRPIYFRPMNLQTEFNYIRETAPRVLAGNPNLALLTEADFEGAHVDPTLVHAVPYEAAPLMALGAATGPVAAPIVCALSAAPSSSSPRVHDLGALVDGCPLIDASATVVYLGLLRPQSFLDRLGRRYRVVPIDEVSVPVAGTIQYVDTTCRLRGVIGSALPDCTIKLGFYRLEPLPAR